MESKDDKIGRLVLARRLGESICIGDDIRIVVYKKKKNTDQFKILIEAPKSVSIAREEIKEDKHGRQQKQKRVQVLRKASDRKTEPSV